MLGVLALFSRQRHEAPEMDSLRLVAEYLAVSIANAQAFEELARLKRCLEIENVYLRADMAPSDKAPLPGDGPAMRELRDNLCVHSRAYRGRSGVRPGQCGRDLHRQSPAAGGRWSGWTAPASPKNILNGISSAPPCRKEPASSAFWRPHGAGLSFLTIFRTCHRWCSASCWASSVPGNSGRLGTPIPSPCTCASWPRLIPACPGGSGRTASGKTCSIIVMSFPWTRPHPAPAQGGYSPAGAAGSAIPSPSVQAALPTAAGRLLAAAAGLCLVG